MIKRTRKLLLWNIFFLSTLFGACNFSGTLEGQIEAPDYVNIMTWNVQALFDAEDNGGEYDEYRAGKGWSAEKYRGRISSVSQAVSSMEIVPDIIAMQEIESTQVVKDITESLSSRGYKWTHFTKCAGMSLGIGIISRFHIVNTKSHSIIVDSNAAPRPILEVRIRRMQNAPEEDLILFICHWKSKLGGADATENIRRASARIIIRRIRELTESEPKLPIIVTGDLNENHNEFYRGNGRIICALLPDDPRSAEIAQLSRAAENGNNELIKAQNDFIVISKNKPPAPRYFQEDTLALYSPWTTELQDGTYFYRGEWETIDHFLLSAGFFDSSGWEFGGCSVVNSAPFTNSNGYPAAYNPRTGFGLSDHLPLLLSLNWQ